MLGSTRTRRLGYRGNRKGACVASLHKVNVPQVIEDYLVEHSLAIANDYESLVVRVLGLQENFDPVGEQQVVGKSVLEPDLALEHFHCRSDPLHR